MHIDPRASAVLRPMFGLECCRLRVGKSRSLSLGFGERRVHGRSDLPDALYGEWEIGTYTGAWRFVREGAVICGSHEVVDSVEELNEQVRRSVRLDGIQALTMLSPFEVRIVLDDMFLDVVALSSDTAEDELFHVFGPNNLYVEYSISGGWKVGTANAPWK